jgi:hypothetical protein
MSDKRIISVCVPARDEVHTMFTFDLVNAISHHIGTTGEIVNLLMSQGTLLCSQRTELVMNAIHANADYLLFLDSDMRFPADTIARLLAHGECVVAANCARRRMPTGPTAGNYDKATGRKVLRYSMPEDTGLEQVDMVGTGVMLVDINVFKVIDMPWFATPWDTAAKGYMGEDVYFCKLLRDNGIPLYIDHDLSKQIGHIGTFEYKHEHTWALRPMEDARRKEAGAPVEESQKVA